MKMLAESVTSLYDPKDYYISNQFCAELFMFWAEFRNASLMMTIKA